MYLWKLSDNAFLIILFFLCSSHGMSYPIAGNVKTHRAKGYNVEHPIVVNINCSTFKSLGSVRLF